MEQNEDLLEWKENNQRRRPQTLSASEGVQSEKRDKKTLALNSISPSPFVSYSTLTCQSVLLTLAADLYTGIWFLSPRFLLLIYTN